MTCKDCSLDGCVRVPGSGPDVAKVVIVGEAPGEAEAQQGAPFVGRGGKLLDTILDEVGLVREDCYLTTAVLCHPEPYKAPNAKQIAACRGRLFSEIIAHKPRVVFALGATALKALTGRAGIRDARGDFIWSEELNATVIPSYHPAAILRSPGLYTDLLKDAHKVMKAVTSPQYIKMTTADVDYILVEDRDTVDALCDRLRELGPCDLSVDVETGSLRQLICLGMSWRPGTAAIVTDRAFQDPYTATALNDALRDKCLLGHNLKFDLQVMWDNGLPSVKTGKDTLLMHYQIDERKGTHGLKHLVRDYLHIADWATTVRPFITKLEECPRKDVYEYNAKDVSYTLMLERALREELDVSTKRVLTELLYPASTVLGRMEYVGTLVDTDYLEEMDVKLSAELKELEAEMFEVVGREFNPRSQPQLLNLLFKELKLPFPGKMSTDKPTLQLLAPYHALPQLVLDYRAKAGFLSRLVRGILNNTDVAMRVHTNFNLDVTATGRLSSSGPNLQNINRGKNARNIFIATPGYLMVEADLSQAEVRGLAWLSRDKELMETLNHEDMHIRTASLIFGVPADDITPDQRTAAKRVTFGLLYGMTAKGLVDQLWMLDKVKMTITEAEELMSRFFGAYRGAQEWIESVKAEVLETGMVRSPFGRIRRFDYIAPEHKETVLRQAVNMPVQSMASDITLGALLRVDNLIQNAKLGNTRLLLTVHDSIILETAEDVREIGNIVREVMEMPVLDGSVPFVADIDYGPRWGQLTKLKRE